MFPGDVTIREGNNMFQVYHPKQYPSGSQNLLDQLLEFTSKFILCDGIPLMIIFDILMSGEGVMYDFVLFRRHLIYTVNVQDLVTTSIASLNRIETSITFKRTTLFYQQTTVNN